MGSTNALVGSAERSPNSLVAAMKSSKTFGYMTADMSCLSSMSTPCVASNVVRTASKSTSGNSAPGLPSKVSSNFFAPLKTSDLKGSGNPPTGMPSAPWKNSTTEEGKFNDPEEAFALTSSADREFVTMNWARSPHVFDDGVTLTMSPNRSFASAYAFLTAGHCSARPFCVAWKSMFVYWPPGISCA